MKKKRCIKLKLLKKNKKFKHYKNIFKIKLKFPLSKIQLLSIIIVKLRGLNKVRV